MPMFMDRHYVEGATAHTVATAHLADLGVQDRFGVKFLTYWFDEDRSTAFCLAESPDEDTIRRAHNEAHGLVPHEIARVDPAVVDAFLGRVSDPVPTDQGQADDGIDPAFRAIMFTDLKDSTLMTSRLGDSRALHLLHVSNVLTRRALGSFGGREIKHTGDGIMASFRSAADSVACAVSVQRAMADHNRREPEDDLLLRIGLHAGEPIEERGDLFGNAVQLAARLCAAAGPAEVLVSDTIRELCPDPEVAFEDRGTAELKGIPEAVQVFAALWAESQ